MRQYRIIVSDGQRETEIVGEYASVDAAREDMKARGYTDVRSIEEVSGAAPNADPPPPRERIAGRPTPDGQWLELDPADAQRHPLYGVGGWLALLAVILIVGAVLVAITAFQLLNMAFSGEGSPGVLMIVMGFILPAFLVQIWLIVLLFRLSPIFPAALLIVSGMAIALGVPSMLAFPPPAPRDLVSIAVIAIWMAYLVLSVRVNVTFKHRVRPGDPLLKAQ
jgi:hypothetical protein